MTEPCRTIRAGSNSSTKIIPPPSSISKKRSNYRRLSPSPIAGSPPFTIITASAKKHLKPYARDSRLYRATQNLSKFSINLNERELRAALDDIAGRDAVGLVGPQRDFTRRRIRRGNDGQTNFAR